MTDSLAMDSELPARKLLLHCVKQLLSLETALRSRKSPLSKRERTLIVLLDQAADGLVTGGKVHPWLEELTVEDLIGFQLDELEGRIRAGRGSFTAPSGQESTPQPLLETT